MKKSIYTPDNRLRIFTYAKRDKRDRTVSVEDIVWLEAESNYTIFHFVNGKKYVVARSFKDYMAILEVTHFVRTHKSYAVNMQHIDAYDVNEEMVIKLRNGNKVAISRRQKKQVLFKLQTALGEVSF